MTMRQACLNISYISMYNIYSVDFCNLVLIQLDFNFISNFYNLFAMYTSNCSSVSMDFRVTRVL